MARLLRIREVLHLTGLTRSTMYSYISRGLFPAPVKIGLKASAWHEGGVQRWINERSSSFQSIPVAASIRDTARASSATLKPDPCQAPRTEPSMVRALVGPEYTKRSQRYP
jgi:prophage regulatory protein